MERKNNRTDGKSSAIGGGYRAFKSRGKSKPSVVEVAGITLNSTQIRQLKQLANEIPGVKSAHFNKFAPGYITILYKDKPNAVHIHWFEFYVRILPILEIEDFESIDNFLTIK